MSVSWLGQGSINDGHQEILRRKTNAPSTALYCMDLILRHLIIVIHWLVYISISPDNWVCQAPCVIGLVEKAIRSPANMKDEIDQVCCQNILLTVLYQVGKEVSLRLGESILSTWRLECSFNICVSSVGFVVLRSHWTYFNWQMLSGAQEAPIVCALTWPLLICIFVWEQVFTSFS